MFGQASFIDEIDCGSFFDHIDDLLDFPLDDVVEAAIPQEELSLNGEVWPSQVPPPVSNPTPEFAVPYEDIVQLEWLSSFVEDSFSGADKEPTVGVGATSLPMSDAVSRRRFQTSSPVSVLESSSSYSGDKSSPRNPEPIGSSKSSRVRSKRPRPVSFTPRPSSSAAPFIFTDTESFAESSLVVEPSKVSQEEKKMKKKKVTSVNSGANSVVRKCMHCEISKTPQWRAGPMGPKTLCNACGVRFKSGRLFPEYRPAASPTFTASLHSNSHKKVLEMRSRVSVGAMMMATKSPKFVAINRDVVMD